MALKFLNKKGWHTGSLRNIENVWKAEQKNDAEQKKLEELRKQIQEERERSEFRQLQEQAGILPSQERLEFLYDSGLAVGKQASSEGVLFKSLDKSDAPSEAAPSSSNSTAATAGPGALFEDKSNSANDAWRKLHSDPLLLIRRREQEALARIKNNPVQMQMIRKSVLGESNKDKDGEKKERRKRRHGKDSSKYKKRASSEPSDSDEPVHAKEPKQKNRGEKRTNDETRHKKDRYGSEDESNDREAKWKNDRHESRKYKEQSPEKLPARKSDDRHPYRNRERYYSERHPNSDAGNRERENRYRTEGGSKSRSDSAVDVRHETNYKRRNSAPKVSEEERAARLREMQADAELHEEQRWKRLKKADDDAAREAKQDSLLRGRNFLDETHKSVYGAEKGGSATIEESVRRRKFYSQGRSEGEGNAFRR